MTIEKRPLADAERIWTDDIFRAYYRRIKAVAYESTNGTDFTRVAIYNSSSYPGMLCSGWSYGDTPVEYTGVAGRYYYAAVKCYAGNSTGGDYRWYDTSPVS